MVINHNMSSMYANRQIGLNETAIAGGIEKLSSGERINRAADDASGLAVSEKMRAQIRGLNKASENVGNGISFIQTTEGYLTETTDILQRVRELAVQSANGIYTDEDRAQIQVEVSQLVSEVDRIASQAQFNGMNMLTGRFAESPLTLQIGANVDQSMKINVNAVTAEKLGLKGTQETAGISIATPEDANNALSIVDTALTTVTKERANLGAYQNRLEMAQNGIDIAAENTQASESKIRDTDMASAMVDFTKDSILTQASVAMLGQANANSAGVLQLLK